MFKNFLKCIVVLLCLIVSASVFAQGTSNKGKDFWVAYQGVRDDLNSRLTLFITSNNNAVVNITAGGVPLTAINIAAGQAVPVLIDPNLYTNTYISNSDQLNINSGIHVTSDVDIIVYCHISFSARSASSLILPVKALGNEYYSISYTQNTITANTNLSEFSLVGVEDNTIVEITPKANSIGNTRLANVTYQITLNKGDVYQYKSSTDLTGSKIKTVGGCKPIAVFSGSTFIAFCEPFSSRSGTTGDPLYQQLFPTSAWGQNFVTAPFFNAQNGASDVIRIQVAKDNTVIKVNGSTISALGVPLNNPYAAGSVITYSAKIPSIIESSSAISVAQFQTTQACNPNNSPNILYPGDPEMTILNPIEQTLKDITVYSAISTTLAPTAITKHYLNIILKTVDIPTLTVDGVAPANNFNAIDAVYSYITIDVTASSLVNPAHRIICNNGFIAIAYGYGSPESYAYLAGADLKNLNAAIEIFEPGGAVEVNSLCIGENYKASLKLPYQTAEIIWNFNNGVKVETIRPTAPDKTEIVNGKTSYYYNHLINAAELQTPGNFSLKATVLNPNPSSCDANEEILSDFEVNALPIAKFTVDNYKPCEGNLVTFTDNSVGIGKNITKWYWDFGDGSPIEERSSAAPFTHIYSNEGDYIAKLYVKSETSCLSSVFSSANIHVAKLPVTNFSFSTLTCLNNEISFTNQSTTVDGNIVKYDWDFDDPSSATNTSNLPNPVHIFNAVKTYNVNLTVTTDLGCTNTIIKQITINPLPVVDFETPDICLSDASALFTNKSTISDNSGLTYVWDFGDPISGASNTSILENPTHKYSVAKDYDVKLTTTSEKGCVTTIIKKFTVNGSTPNADFIIANEAFLCSNQTVNFTDNSKVDFGEITKIEWIYDNTNLTLKETDNSPNLRNSTAKIYTHTYPTFYSPAQKTVNVTMTAYSGIECSNTETKSIILKAIPKADFILPDGCLPNGEALFTNQSTFVGSDVGLTYLWDFGDGINSSSAQKNPVYKYKTAGTYQVTLTVTAPNGCIETIKKPFVVKGAVANTDFNILNINSLCSDAKVEFVDQTTISFGELNKIEWFFDFDNQANNPAYYLVDNNPSLRSETFKNYSFTYPIFNTPLTKTVNVKLKTTSGNNCVSEIIKTITLKAVPNVVFVPLKGVCAEVSPYNITQASETSGMVGTGIYSGKGITAAGLFSPLTAGVGKHTITYTFTGANGCEAVKQQDIEVFETPKVDAGIDKVILLGGEIVLDAIANGKNVRYKWTPSTGLNKDDIINPIAKPIQDITYNLTVTSGEGCVINDDVFVKVLKFPEIPNTFTPNGDGVNDTWNIKYLSSYPNASIKIFNRYGKEVFNANNYATPWDGKLNNEYLPEGVYYYIILAKNGELKYSGSVTLIK